MHPWNPNMKSTGRPGEWTQLLRQTVPVGVHCISVTWATEAGLCFMYETEYWQAPTIKPEQFNTFQPAASKKTCWNPVTSRISCDKLTNFVYIPSDRYSKWNVSLPLSWHFSKVFRSLPTLEHKTIISLWLNISSMQQHCDYILFKCQTATTD